jgi:hypothetical protein
LPYTDKQKQLEAMREINARARLKQKEALKALDVLSTSFMEKVGNEINQKKKEEETKTE